MKVSQLDLFGSRQEAPAEIRRRKRGPAVRQAKAAHDPLAHHREMMQAPLVDYVRYTTGARMSFPENLATLRRWVRTVGEAEVRERLILIQYPYNNPRCQHLSDLDWHVCGPIEEVFWFAL